MPTGADTRNADYRPGALRALGVLALCVAAIGCSPAPPAGGSEPLPAELRVGVLPGESAEELQAQFDPLLGWLSEELDRPVTLRVPDSYAHLVELFHAREVDLAHFGGVTFVEASRCCGAVPLVVRDTDLRFTSYVLVRAEHPAEELVDLAGARFAFGSPLSTSGHYMPRHFLEQRGIVPETFFSGITFTGRHDETARWVQEGRVDAGAAKAPLVDHLFETGALDHEKVRVLWETPPYADYVWAVQPSFDGAVRSKIRDAFLSLTSVDDRHVKILRSLRAGVFLPADEADFRQLRDVVGDRSAVEVAR